VQSDVSFGGSQCAGIESETRSDQQRMGDSRSDGRANPHAAKLELRRTCVARSLYQVYDVEWKLRQGC
jgi:hypothetical protein